MDPEQERLAAEQAKAQMLGAVNQAVQTVGANPTPNPGTVPRPQPPPPALEGGSAMTPQEIGVDNIQQRAKLQPMPAPQMPLSRPDPATVAQSQVAAAQPRGFDWARAFLSAGKGDVAAYDAANKYRDDKPMRDAQTEALAQQQRMARDAIDPASSTSREAQQRYAKIMLARASAPGVSNEMADIFRQEAEKAASMTALQVDRANQTFGQLMGEYGKLLDADATRALTGTKLGLQQEQINATREHNQANTDIQKQKVGLEGAVLNETTRHHKAVEDAALNKGANALPPGEQVAKYNQKKVLRDNVARALDLLDKVRYTGRGAEFIHGVLSGSNATDVLLPEEREFVSLVNSLRAGARNKIFGAALSKYDIADAGSFLASLGKSKETIRANLKRDLDDANQEISGEETYYPALKKGQAAPSGDPAAEAKAWLEANPNDPRADAVRKKLGM